MYDIKPVCSTITRKGSRIIVNMYELFLGNAQIFNICNQQCMANGTCISLKHGTIATILYVGIGNIISAYTNLIMSNCMNNQLTTSH